VNWNAFQQLQRRFDCVYVGPIVPRVSPFEVLVSRLQRKLFRRPGAFAYFSPSTLASNAERVTARIPVNADTVMFRSAARWCRVQPDMPYFVYLDAVFHTFFHNTFDADDFDRSDIERIFEEEAAFLEKATGVFFESKWGMQKAKEAYSLRGNKYLAAGRGGSLNPPDQDRWNGNSRELVTIAMNFSQKGGDVVLEAFKMLKPRFPELTWRIIGGRPPAGTDTVPGITYEGLLDPGNPDDCARLERIMSDAFLLVHPAREDTSPLVITEAAYFGCPSISVNRFAIPELVHHGVTGILVEDPHPGRIADAIAELLVNPDRYRDMRMNARTSALANSSWDSVGALMADVMCASIDCAK
jgi:glycosyltransferase involved in cell wall biosynthesis